jgi:DNA (cytosine-5)-methyltransferase 1
LDAADYGIPQHRERMFLVGHNLESDFLFPRPLYGPDARLPVEHICTRKAFQGISHNEDLNQLILKGGKYSHLLESVPPGQNYLFFTAKRGYPNPIFAYRSRFSDFLYKADPDKPTKTIIASPGKYTGPLHWDNRYFSIAEYKRLQGFPDDYEFCGNRSEVIKQIGNSVSPAIARTLADTIAAQIFERNVDIDLLTTEEKLSFDKRKGRQAKQTQALHLTIARQPKRQIYTLESYQACVMPHSFTRPIPNVSVEAKNNKVEMIVKEAPSMKRLFAKIKLRFSPVQTQLELSLNGQRDNPVIMNAKVYGNKPHCIQTLWNAIDDWVIRSSNFHSLFELYGHFTEPYPCFTIEKFEAFSDHPIVEFAQHISKFSNCSKYLSIESIERQFGGVFETNSFEELADKLRSFRFDIRFNGTNVAIPEGKYMVAYPFTLPHRKQMNFAAKSDDSKKHSWTNGVKNAPVFLYSCP